MTKIAKSITILAPVEKVFEYMDNPANMPEIWPSMVEVRNVRREANGGNSFDWTYKMAGVRMDGHSDVLEHIPNKRLVTHSKQGIESTFTWTLFEEKGHTILHVEAEYKIPVPLLGKLAEAVIAKENEREADTLLANLKTVMETEHVPV